MKQSQSFKPGVLGISRIADAEPAAEAETPAQLDPGDTESASGGATDKGPAEADIATRAYLRWLERGRPEGSPQEDWYRAEAELKELAQNPGKDRTSSHK